MKKRDNILKVLKYLVLSIGAFAMLVPFAWMILTAFKTTTEATQMNPFVIFPKKWKVDAFDAQQGGASEYHLLPCISGTRYRFWNLSYAAGVYGSSKGFGGSGAA